MVQKLYIPSSSSSGVTTSLFESFGFLNYVLLFNPFLDAFCPIICLHNSLIFFFIVFALNFWSSCESCRHRFPLIQFVEHPIICHLVYIAKPALTYGPNVINYILISNWLFSSSFVLILLVPSLSFAGPNILNTFLLIISNFIFIDFSVPTFCWHV